MIQHFGHRARQVRIKSRCNFCRVCHPGQRAARDHLDKGGTCELAPRRFFVERRQDAGVDGQVRFDRFARLAHQRHGGKRRPTWRRSRLSPILRDLTRARGGALVGRRLLDHANPCFRQHQCACDHDRREGGGRSLEDAHRRPPSTLPRLSDSIDRQVKFPVLDEQRTLGAPWPDRRPPGLSTSQGSLG